MERRRHMAVADDMEEEVGGVVADAEVADFVDDEDGGLDVGLAGGSEAGGAGEVDGEGGGSGEEGVEAMLDGLVGDGDSEVGLAAAGRAGERMPVFPLRG
jgi:hypothetical protein